MKKFISILLIAALAITGYTLWQKEKAHSSDDNGVPVKGIVFSAGLKAIDIRFDDVEKVLHYQLKNTSGKLLQYGFAFTIHKLQDDGTLKDTELTKDMAFIEMLGILEDGKTMEDAIMFSQFPDFPGNGTYYVIRQYTDEEGNHQIPLVSFKVSGGVVTPVK